MLLSICGNVISSSPNTYTSAEVVCPEILSVTDICVLPFLTDVILPVDSSTVAIDLFLLVNVSSELSTLLYNRLNPWDILTFAFLLFPIPFILIGVSSNNKIGLLIHTNSFLFVTELSPNCP